MLAAICRETSTRTVVRRSSPDSLIAVDRALASLGVRGFTSADQAPPPSGPATEGWVADAPWAAAGMPPRSAFSNKTKAAAKAAPARRDQRPIGQAALDRACRVALVTALPSPNEAAGTEAGSAPGYAGQPPPSLMCARI